MTNKKKLYLMYPQKKGTIAPEIYGHFAEHIGGVIYDGIWVGKDSSIPNINGFRKEIIEKLRAIKAPVIRWPGGCFAEIYDWRDGIGEERPTRINWWTRKDGRYETNEVGTHEFMDFCEAVGASGYFAANLTSVTPLQIRNWMDYCLSPRGTTTLAKEREKNGHPEPFDIKYWGVGNENWGCGGRMRPEFYADECRRFAEVMRNTEVTRGVETNIEYYACGNDADQFDWTRGVMPVLSPVPAQPISGYAMHYYCINRDAECLDFSDDEWKGLLRKADRMEKIIEKNWSIISANDMENKCKLVVDEWGSWHGENSGPSKGENLWEQQNTMRDAMVAAHTLNIFNRHCDKVRMANIAQLVNNIHSLFLAGGENCITTPTYHVFDMYKEHQGAELIEAIVTDNEDFDSSITVSASVKEGKTLVTIGNISCDDEVEISLEAVGASIPSDAKAIMLYNEDIHAHNTFENPKTVVPTDMDLDISKPFTIPKAGILAIRF